MDWRRKLAQNNSVLGLKIFLRQNLPAHVAHEYWVFRYIQPKSAMATKLAILKYKLTKKCQFITGSKLISIENSLEPLSEIFIMH